MESKSTNDSNPFFVFDASKVCATCTKHLLDKVSYPLDTVVDRTTYINLFQVLQLHFEFKSTENGPNNICSECYDKTLATYELSQQCKKSLMLFNKYVKYQKQLESLDDIDLHISDSDTNTALLDEDKSIKPKLDKENQLTSKPSISTKNSGHMYKCTLCDASYNKYASYFHHKTIHSKRFVCSYCGRSISSSFALVLHERIHTGELPYPCGKCSKKFKSKYELEQHLPIHSRKRPFKCEVCDKKFKTRSGLCQHIEIHRGTKRNACTECNASFVQLRSLKKHMREHEEGDTKKDIRK